MGSIPMPATLPPFDSGYIVVMNSVVYQVLREVLCNRAFARVDESPWPTAAVQRGSFRGHVQLRPPAADRNVYMPPAEVERWTGLMWQQQEEISDVDADVLDGLGVIWLHQAQVPDAQLRMHVNQFLQLRGLQPKRGSRDGGAGIRPSSGPPCSERWRIFNTSALASRCCR